MQAGRVREEELQSHHVRSFLPVHRAEVLCQDVDRVDWLDVELIGSKGYVWKAIRHLQRRFRRYRAAVRARRYQDRMISAALILANRWAASQPASSLQSSAGEVHAPPTPGPDGPPPA